MALYTNLKPKADGSWSDEFQRKELANSVAKVLADQPCDSLPVVAGVFAPWGGGKTHFARQVGDALKKSDSEAKILWFEPWRYQSRQDVAAAIILRLFQEIKNDTPAGKAAAKKIKRTGKLIGKVFARSIGKQLELATGVPVNEAAGAIAEGWSDPDPGYQSDTDDLIATLGELVGDWKGEHHSYMFIDDLDRCLPEQMIRMMEALHVFLAQAPMTFIVALDRSALEAAVDQRYGGKLADVGRNYVDKIVHLPFTLPPLTPSGVEAKYGERLETMGIVGTRKELLNSVLGDNPRQVERFMNHFDLAKRLAEAGGVVHSDQDGDALVLLSVLRIRFPAFCDAWDRRPAEALPEFARIIRANAGEWQREMISANFSELIPFGEPDHPVRALIRALDEHWWGLLATYPNFDKIRSFTN